MFGISRKATDDSPSNAFSRTINSSQNDDTNGRLYFSVAHRPSPAAVQSFWLAVEISICSALVGGSVVPNK